ncbi:iron chelate uptake ABC transporter family permease subunit [Sulfuriroseicoccus oceanibius]|uniref:Metal ABC transporter permease n=1 Tax=Sulfuriroseicoccus oceanibius TaxID=2707525 RepID=A0A6B3L5X8_9BACT|nr:iron chelate uptake ABC transporter family permease subunit [Sulfuriroseicoccus oceanibius]QQL45450.1 metal ABC transporter permease [Sulfuriroseicoccus oceanibius]
MRTTWCLLPVLLLMCLPSVAHAARPSDMVEVNAWDQLLRFVSLRDEGVRYLLGGSLLLGLGCGVLGSFMVVRKLALAGDALAHSVLPGVVLGFLFTLTKDPLNLFIGAVVAGMISMGAVTALRNTTKLKQDAVLGIVLSGFFAIGICLLTMVQGIPHADMAGLDHILFGQAAALGPADLRAMAWSTGISVVLIVVLYPKFLVLSFDTAFAQSLGLPVRLLHHLLMLLLTFSVVVAMQAVGVVLVSAMLITPAAAAYLITQRFHRMLVWAALFGMVSGALGALLSFLDTDLPTGPLMVLAASAIFAGAFLFSPREGVVVKWRRARHRSARVHRENLLKAVYHIHERENFSLEGVTLLELAAVRRQTIDEVQQLVKKLEQRELATRSPDGGMLFLTDAGMARAAQLVRNHRLWELYLTNAADYAPDHVHDDAERIEHVLGEPIVRELEKRLDFPQLDPHGKPIPAVASKPA